MCTPLIAALRTAGHPVSMALSDRNADIFAPGVLARQHVLERIPWPRHGSTPESADRARAAIAAAEYDVALIVSEEPEAYELGRGIAVRAGFTTGWAKPFKSLWVRSRLTHRVPRAATAGTHRAHEVELVYGLADNLRLHAEPAPPRDPVRLRPLLIEAARARPLAARSGVVVQLTAKWLTIGLGATCVAALLRGLTERGARLVVSAAEIDVGDQLAPGAPLDVCPDIAAWKAALDAARVVVTPDTGAAHLAGMLGVPVVDCFPNAHARAGIRRWHPWAAPYRALTARDLSGPDAAARLQLAIDAL